jgi:MFS family permease
MYGGGFATIPAYLADLFGAGHVSAIHGRLLTAWSTAGVLGPVLVNYIREFQIDHGVPRAQSYNITMYVLAGLLVVGLVCNLAVRPLEVKLAPADQRPAEAGRERRGGPAINVTATSGTTSDWALVAIAWLLVSAPLAWGTLRTLTLAFQLFR